MSIATVMRMMLVAPLMLALGCSDVSAPGSTADPDRIYARLELSYHTVALSLAPGFDTMTLQASARTPTGAAVVGADSVAPVSYQVLDGATAVRVTADGKVTAVRTVGRVLVAASQTIGSVTLIDTAVIKVTALPDSTLTVHSISVQPLPGDSAKVDCSGRYTDTLYIRSFDASSNTLPVAVLPAFRSSDPSVATIGTTGEVRGIRPGQTTIRVDAYIYSHGVRDSVVYTVGDPLVQLIFVKQHTLASSPDPVFYTEPADVVIGVGGSVSWINMADDSVGIEFADPTAALPAVGATAQMIWFSKVVLLSSLVGCSPQGSGNILPLQVGQRFQFGDVIFSVQYTCPSVGARAFTRPGTYTYRSSRTGVAGRVIVR